LGTRAIATFKQNFLDLKRELLFTTKTAAEVASKLAVGLYQPIMEQLDPMRIGEMDRAVSIVSAYGERLVRKGKNAKGDALSRLVAGYPSHTFVIDRAEAKDLFKSIQDPAEGEEEFFNQVQSMSRKPLDNRAEPYIFFMNDPEAPDDQSAVQHASDSGQPGDPGAGAGAGPQAGEAGPAANGDQRSRA
jgi:hypothetical protein